MRTLLCVLAMMWGAGMVCGQAASPGAAQPGFGACRDYNNDSSRPIVPVAYDPNAATFQSNGFLAPTVPVQYSVPLATPPCPPTASVSAASVEDPTACDEPVAKHRFWLSASYAALFIQPQRIAVPIVTTGSPADANPGALGQPGTVIRSGNELNFGMLSGVQTDAGIILDADGCVALSWSSLFVAPAHVRYGLASDAAGNPLIARPVFNVNSGLNQSVIDSNPGAVSGAFNLDARTAIFGTEANLTYRCKSADRSHFDVLGGFRYLRLAEDLTLLDQLTPLVPGALTFETGMANPPNSLVDMDKFRTANNFYGVQLGGAYAMEKNKWVLTTYGKAALGVTSQLVNIQGSTALVTPTGRQFAGGGVLALPSNMGQYTQNVLGFVPEAGMTLGFNVTRHLQLTVGYSFLYWNSVVRPGGQLNNTVNPTQIPTTSVFGTATGPAVPQFQFLPETFWMQNLNGGFTLHF